MIRITVALLLAVAAARAETPAEIAAGRALYMKVGCYQCHGTEGQGGAAGPRIAPEPMPWEAFAQYVHNAADAMPPYREAVLPAGELKAIHLFLQSIPPPKPVEQIPLLRQRR
jgi:ubiquinol-cytochrome c reductase cytochrome c subunit